MAHLKLLGDTIKAGLWIPYAKKQLKRLRDSMIPAGLLAGNKRERLPDGGTLIVRFSNYFGIPEDWIIIRVPIIGGPLLLYLVTIAIPMRDEAWGDFVAWTDYDADNLHVCKTYAYKLDETTGILSPIGYKVNLIHNDYTVGGGLTLTMQEGFMFNRQTHYAQLSNMYSQEEEIGGLDWYAFQQAGGYSLNFMGLPDTNTYWGYSFPRFWKMATYGSLKGLKNPDPKTRLYDSYAARKGYVLSGNNVLYNDLIFNREVIWGEFAPAYWDYEPGQAMFIGIVEYLNPNYRWVYKHIINALNIRTNATKSTIIAEDEHELQNYPTESGLDTSLNWKYHVPIIAVTEDKALMRIVERVGTNKTCWEATLTEELVIGKSDDHINLDDISVVNTGGLTATSVAGSDTINNYETKGYYLDGCQQDDQTFTFTGGGGYTVSGNSIIAGANVCGIITATGTCTSCGISASKEIIAQGGHWHSIGTCGVDSTWYVWAGADNTTVIVGGYKYICAHRMMVNINPTGFCCDSLSYDCTGEGTIDVPCAGSCTDYRYPANPSKCYQVYGLAGMSVSIWSC